MFRLIMFVFRAIMWVKLFAFAFGAGMGTAYLLQLRELYRSWGRVEGGRKLAMRGDDLVPQAELVETRQVDIDATREQVWPWLAQMGYGRGGWYGFAALERPWSPGGGPAGKSAEDILDEFQDLAEGDLVPTHPQGGFEARVVEPGEALVLYLDDVMFRDQLGELAKDVNAAADAVGQRGPGVQLGDDLEMPPYKVSWAFELQDLPGGRTRLVERLRAHIEATEMQWRARPLLTAGVFVLLRSQMLGIKERAEHAARS